MRIVPAPFALFSLSTLFLFGLSPVPVSIAPGEGPSASGRFEIFLDNSTTRHIEFHAARELNGNISGETIFSDDSAAPRTDASTDGASSEAVKPFFLKAEFDCLQIEGNKAVMSGAVTESSLEQYLGRRVLVVAQENGGPEGTARRDKLTWGVYRNKPNEWVPADSERPDELSGLSWIATDAERLDDEGIPSNKEKVIGCQSFPLSSFSFINASQGRGTVHVKP